MSKEGKISFSFSKVKQPPLANTVKESKEKIEYVDCFDGSKGTFSFKGNIRNEESTKKELVIPLISSKTSSDIVKSRIEGRSKEKNGETNHSNNGEATEKNSGDDSGKSEKNLEEIAASEILDELKNNQGQGKSKNNLVIESNDAAGQEPSEADIDYDQVPVGDFGLAMLRGMGWKPDSGIGKEPRLVATVSPKLRPKGLGLGAKHNLEQNESSEKSQNLKPESKSDSKSKHRHR